jgi:hypothetical protein
MFRWRQVLITYDCHTNTGGRLSIEVGNHTNQHFLLDWNEDPFLRHTHPLLGYRGWRRIYLELGDTQRGIGVRCDEFKTRFK